ncbi:MAG: PAS domain S-box protein [Syntrophomonadaceae bacterium]|nr:PAS domain S-box protein [Syntrophomonadaceae bacterium]
MQPHDHACLIYESEDEWRDNVIPFIIAGLKQGEKCVYGLNHRSQQYILDCLREEGINVAAYEESGQLLILDKSILPGESDGDRLDQMQDFYIQYLKKWLAEGYPAVRFTSESLYNLIGIESTKTMVEVNSRMNTMLFPHYPCAALCQYDRFKTDPKLLKYAILSHPIVIKNNELYVNLASIPDERFLEITSDRWEAEHWLAVIERENRDLEKLQMVDHTLNNSSQPLLCFQADGSVMACNKGFYQLMDRSGQSIQHLGEMEPYWREYLTEIIQELQQTGTHRYEREWPLPGGGRMVVDLSILEGFDNFGKLAYYFVSLSDVTGQKEAQEALRRSEEHFRLMAENAYDMISIIDRQTFQHKYLSPSHERIVGYKAEELMGKSCLMHVHPEDIKSVIKKLQEGIKKGSAGAQYRARNKDGVNLWFDSFGKVIESGEYKGDVLLITRDITERKMAEIAMRNSEEKYRLIVDNAYDGISIFDSSTLISTYQNPALKKMLGYPENAMLNRPLFEFVHPDELTMVEETLKEGLENGQGCIQCQLRKNDGSYIWMEINGRVMHRDSDSPHLLFITRDISQRKRVEEELRASETRLRYSEQELRQQLDYLNYLINTMGEVFVTYDLNHRITFVNHAVYKQLGYQPEELLGINVIDFIIPPDKERMATYIGTRLLDGKPGIFETVVKRKNGSEALVRIKSSPIKEEDTVVGAMLLLEDISEYRKIQKEMARLDQLNTVGEIAAGIGHEIRNPMTTVKGFLQMLSQNEDFIHHQHYFNLMLDELERANGIISEFLALAKNKLVDLQPRNLNSIITAIFPLLQADALLADKSIVLDLAEIPDLLLDEKEVRQLILNLVRNGLEAMQTGGTVYISTRLEEEQVVLSVRDEGKGIDHELLDKLGTPFITTKDNGTGLGLAICFSIVARHEASMHPYTSPTGSTFIIRFKIPCLDTEQMTLPLV